MKNTKKLFIILSILSTFFISCNDPIFYNIMQDVPPEDATVSGYINSICHFGDNNTHRFVVTYSQDGVVYKSADNNEHIKWKSLKNLPFSLHKYEYYNGGHTGEQIIKIAADKTNLYIITVSYMTNDHGINCPDIFHIWTNSTSFDYSNGISISSSEEWKDINNSETKKNIYIGGLLPNSSDNYYHTNFNVFCTNDIYWQNRVAFIRSDKGELFKLNGVSSPTQQTSINSPDGATSSNINSACYSGSTLLFFKSTASVSNSTSSSAGNIVYYGSGSDLYYYKNSVSNKVLDAGETISCLTYTKDTLFIGRADYSSSTSSRGGLVKTSLEDDGTPDSSLHNFTTNAKSQFPSSYLIFDMIVTDPTKSEIDATAYISIGFRGSGASTTANFDNVGLYSYYPNRGNWNRE